MLELGNDLRASLRGINTEYIEHVRILHSLGHAAEFAGIDEETGELLCNLNADNISALVCYPILLCSLGSVLQDSQDCRLTGDVADKHERLVRRIVRFAVQTANYVAAPIITGKLPGWGNSLSAPLFSQSIIDTALQRPLVLRLANKHLWHTIGGMNRETTATEICYCVSQALSREGVIT